MSPRSRGPGAYVRRIAGTGPPRPITGPIAAAGIGPIHDVPVRSAPRKRGKGVLRRGEGASALRGPETVRPEVSRANISHLGGGSLS